jgi:hypothetical protein
MEDEQAPVISEARKKWLWDQQDDLEHRICLSAAYHGRKERFFNIWERLFQAAAALTATAAFADLSGRDTPIAKWFALAAAVASIIPLVFNLAGNAQRHGQLKAGFKSIQGMLYASGSELPEDQINTMKAKVAELESGEPAAMPGVVLTCQNEIATRERKMVYPLNFWERCIMHFYPMDTGRIIQRAMDKKAKADRKAAAKSSTTPETPLTN